ncbi:hypothetical protein WP12_06620 [Sphingomonas sp. SRS2]|nr:hypothetical protein WP12_06620 [Sphingomonas sp. SRS2]
MRRHPGVKLTPSTAFDRVFEPRHHRFRSAARPLSQTTIPTKKPSTGKSDIPATLTSRTFDQGALPLTPNTLVGQENKARALSHLGIRRSFIAKA